MTNGIWQSLGLDLVNINVYAKFYKNIPYAHLPITRIRNRDQYQQYQQSIEMSVWLSSRWVKNTVFIFLVFVILIFINNSKNFEGPNILNFCGFPIFFQPRNYTNLKKFLKILLILSKENGYMALNFTRETSAPDFETQLH